MAIYFVYSVVETVKLFISFKKEPKSITLEELFKTFLIFAVIIFSVDLIQMIVALIADIATKPFSPLIAPGLGNLVNTKINLDNIAFDFIALNISWAITKQRRKEIKDFSYFFTIISVIALAFIFIYISVVPIITT